MAELQTYDLTFDERDSYLFAHIKSDQITPEVATQYHSEISARCRELRARRLMVVRDIPNVLPTAPLFFASESLPGLLGRIRTAVINPYPANKDALEFAAMIAHNRGVDIGIFDDEAAAEVWLLR